MQDSLDRPSSDALAELRSLREHASQWSKQVSAAENARIAAEASRDDAFVRADRAERAERQISADRDRWKRLALAHEAELKSLRGGKVRHDP